MTVESEYNPVSPADGSQHLGKGFLIEFKDRGIGEGSADSGGLFFLLAKVICGAVCECADGKLLLFIIEYELLTWQQEYVLHSQRAAGGFYHHFTFQQVDLDLIR